MSKKKAFLVLSLLAGSVSAAWAQSSVTVYGILDGGVSYTSGIAGGARKQVVSGIMDGSRLGFRGNEDIGGGYRALFLLENRLELDTGTNSNTPVSGTTFLPDRWGKQSAIFTPTTFTLPGTIPPALAAQLIGGATAGLNSAMQTVTSTLGGRLAAASICGDRPTGDNPVACATGVFGRSETGMKKPPRGAVSLRPQARLRERGIRRCDARRLRRRRCQRRCRFSRHRDLQP